ncbi:hypothetical protein BI375_22290 [Vibrio rotiferianus]|uniref:Lipoprotein n=1 Tax=Vibrio rotiferianus TaxID=190895 RepID=A0ABX3D635_9VIBR|nr:DUF6279 family lipoprotein [Vibrio rotiferianus]OHY91023.1 hypothetical protein BI375_22290 [Vibrio rotiferianus]
MIRTNKTWLRVIFVITVCTLLFGCAKTLFYKNIDWFVIDYIDDYVSLDREQEAILEDRINRLAAWHKSEELPRYIAHLKELESWNKDTLSIDKLKTNREALKEHYSRVVNKAAPDLFSLSLLLTEDQQQEFLKNVKKKYDEKDEKYADKTEQEIRNIIYESALDALENWIGTATNKQKQIAKVLAQNVELNTTDWRTYRASIYTELELLFQSQQDSSTYQRMFMNLLFQPESYYGVEMNKKIERNIDKTDDFTLAIAQSMTGKQWKHFHNEIREWRELAEELMQ